MMGRQKRQLFGAVSFFNKCINCLRQLYLYCRSGIYFILIFSFQILQRALLPSIHFRTTEFDVQIGVKTFHRAIELMKEPLLGRSIC